jgi:hypothetical protein
MLMQLLNKSKNMLFSYNSTMTNQEKVVFILDFLSIKPSRLIEELDIHPSTVSIWKNLSKPRAIPKTTVIALSTVLGIPIEIFEDHIDSKERIEELISGGNQVEPQIETESEKKEFLKDGLYRISMLQLHTLEQIEPDLVKILKIDSVNGSKLKKLNSSNFTDSEAIVKIYSDKLSIQKGDIFKLTEYPSVVIGVSDKSVIFIKEI